ncbi:MAG: hypothetical protein ACREQ3_27555, partial [Candidatus Binatia bacterium]
MTQPYQPQTYQPQTYQQPAPDGVPPVQSQQSYSGGPNPAQFPQPPSDNSDESDSFFGSRTPGFSWAHDGSMGYWRGGTIIRIDQETQQLDYYTKEPKFFPDSGKKRMQLPVTVVSDERDPGNPEDDGHRRIFIKGHMKTAIENAFKEVNAPGLRLGGKLFVCWTHGGEVNNPDRTKYWAAKYEPPQPGRHADQYFMQGGQQNAAQPTTRNHYPTPQPSAPVTEYIQYPQNNTAHPGQQLLQPPQLPPTGNPATLQQAAQYVASADVQQAPPPPWQQPQNPPQPPQAVQPWLPSQAELNAPQQAHYAPQQAPPPQQTSPFHYLPPS